MWLLCPCDRRDVTCIDALLLRARIRTQVWYHARKGKDRVISFVPGPPPLALGRFSVSWLAPLQAPRPSSGPHKLRESLPLVILLRNRLKYALTYKEVMMILKQRQIEVDGRVRTDTTFPAGFMDVVSIPKTGENFRMLYDTKGRYVPLKVSADEAKFKLGKVVQSRLGPGGVPFIVTHDGKTMRFVNPAPPLAMRSVPSMFVGCPTPPLCQPASGNN